MKKNILCIKTLEALSGMVSDGIIGLSIHNDFETAILMSLRKAWYAVLKLQIGVEISEDNIFKDNVAAFYAILDGCQDKLSIHQLQDKGIEVTVATLIREFNSTINKNAHAYVSADSLINTKLENAYLNLNIAVWNLEKLGAVCIAFPDSPSPWKIHAVDPAGLRVNKIKENVPSYVDRAVLLGVYICGDYNQNLFDTGMNVMVDVVLRIDHEKCEIRTRMTLEQAQSLWKGYQIISCDIITKPNGISDIVGSFIII